MILFSAADLLWATRIKAMAEDLGLPARPVRNLEMLRDRLGEGPVSALIVDLDLADLGLDLIRAAASADGQSRPATIVAFGPHVATDLLEAAAQAGADKILARGAFSSNLPELLRSLGEGAKS